MHTQAKLDKFFQKALNQLFVAVGFAGFDAEFAKRQNWFQQKSWDVKTREEFKTWFFKEARQDLKWSKALCQKEFSHFDFMYGWSLLDPEEEKRKKDVIQKALGQQLELGND